MSKTINFVADTRRRLSAAQQNDKKLLQLTIKICVGFMVAFIAVIGVRLYFVYQVNQVQAAQSQARQAILERQEIEKEYNIFAHKLRQLSDLFGKRKDKQEAFLFFSRVFGQEVMVSSIDYTSDKGDVVSFSLNIPSIFLVDDVFEILNSDEVKQNYTSVAKNSLSRSSAGSYALRLTVALGEKVKTEQEATGEADLEGEVIEEEFIE
jgi:hypothetical protein